MLRHSRSCDWAPVPRLATGSAGGESRPEQAQVIFSTQASRQIQHSGIDVATLRIRYSFHVSTRGRGATAPFTVRVDQLFEAPVVALGRSDKRPLRLQNLIKGAVLRARGEPCDQRVPEIPRSSRGFR